MFSLIDIADMHRKQKHKSEFVIVSAHDKEAFR